MTTGTNPYFDELGDIHVELQGWFNSAADAGSLERLMARFLPEFTIVMPSGATLDHAGLRDVFAKLGGQRVGSVIAITDMAVLVEYPGGAVVTYREFQRDAAGNANVRRSTAVLQLDAHGKVTWRHLQETFCAE